MGKVQEVYEIRIKPLAPNERLELARLILDDLSASAMPMDVNDEWSDEDMADVARFSADASARVNRGDDNAQR